MSSASGLLIIRDACMCADDVYKNIHPDKNDGKSL